MAWSWFRCKKKKKKTFLKGLFTFSILKFEICLYEAHRLMVNLAIPGTLGNFLQNEKNLNEKKKGVLFGEYKSVIKTFFFFENDKA